MKKRMPLLVLSAVCLTASAAALAACGGGHHFEEEWSSDGTYHYHKCTDEGCTEQTDKAKHVWDNGTPLNSATCTEEGSVKFKCTVCDYETTQPTDPLNHSWGDWTVTADSMPTKTEEGKATRSCTRDNCTAVDTLEITLPNLSGSDYALSDVTATCENDGTATYTYENDGETVVFSTEKAALGHTMSTTYTVTETEHYRECLHEGCEYKTLQGNHIWQISAEGVSDTNLKYVCAACHKEDDKTVNFKAVEDGENTVSVTHGETTTLSYYKYTATASGLQRLRSESPKAYVTVIVDGSIINYGDAKGINNYFNLEEGESVYLIFDTNNKASSAEYTFTLTSPGTTANPVRINNSVVEDPLEITLKANEKRYYALAGYALLATFDEEGVSLVCNDVTYTGANATNILLDARAFGGVSGDRESTADEYLLFCFTSEKEVTFTVTFVEKFDAGTYSNPISMPFNEEVDVDILVETTVLNGQTSRECQQLFYLFTPEESGWYRFYSTDSQASFISNAYDTYGDGNGFDVSLYIDLNNAAVQGAGGYLFQLTASNRQEAHYTVKVERGAEPQTIALGENVTATEESKFFKFVTESEAEYIFTVSTLGESGSFTVEYSTYGNKQSVVVTETSTKIIIQENTTVYIKVNSPCTLKVEKNETDPYAIGLGTSPSLKGTPDDPKALYKFTAPTAGTYTFTINTTSFKTAYWKIITGSGETKVIQQASYELALTEGETVTVAHLFSSARKVTILPEGTQSLSLTTAKTLSLEAGKKQLVHLAGTAGATYLVNLSVSGLTLTDYYDSSVTGTEFTTDENGNLLLWLESVNGEAVAEIEVTVGGKVVVGATALTAKLTYIFKAEQDGDYVISGIKLGKTPTSNGYFMVNGENAIVNETGATASDLSYTIENVKVGDIITFYSPVAQATFELSLAE